MAEANSLRKRTLFPYALSWFLPVLVSAGSLPENHSWRIYYNPAGQYCVDYPSRWAPAEAFEGAGLLLIPSTGTSWESPGEIDVEAIADQGTSANGVAGQILLEEVRMHFDALKKFERAEQLELLEQRNIHFFGASGLFLKGRYYDPQDHAVWVNEIIFAYRASVIYRLQLTSGTDALGRFEAVFARFVNSFQFDCRARVTPLDAKASPPANSGSTNVIESIRLYPHRAMR